jgi:C4-dicarboxylate-specific signal transduction histidine kinase
MLTGRGIHDDAIEEIISRIELDNQRSGDIVAALRSIFTQEGVITSCISTAEALNSVVRLVQGECIRLGIALEVHIDDALINANRVELQQVFLNLLNNAIDALKTNQQTEQKSIWLRCMKHSDSVQVLISDNGPGISEQLAPRIFDLFETSKKAGMGLGLWLSQYCIQRIDGEISYAPRVGGGSEFVVDIPLKRDIAQ